MLFKIVYAISNWFYRAYHIILLKILIRKMLKLDVAERRQRFLAHGFRMIDYSESEGVQTRVYQHKNGIKITDRVTRLPMPVSQNKIEADGDSIEFYGLLGLLTRPQQH